MIKPIQSNEIFNTPFVSNKSWSLNSSSSIQTVEEGYFVSSSYNFYDSASAALYGFTAAEQNDNGTYKRLVYQLVKNAYYNSNIALNFGLETTDTDKVVKILQNTCIRVTLPRIYFGDSILRDSVVITDYSKDKVYTFFDDTYGNLYVDGTHFINYVDLTSNVYSPPTVNFTATPLSGYAPLTTVLSPSIQGNATEFLWNLGDGTTSTSSNAFSHVYVDPGTYTVSLTATGFGGSSTKTRSNYITANVVIPAPTIDFSFTPTEGYVPLQITFTSSTSNVDYYTWNFGDGTTSSLANPVKTYSSPGIYTVSLTGTGGGGTRTTTKINCIEADAIPLPSPNFIATPNTGYATITSMAFTDGTTSNPLYPVTAWSWNFGDGGATSSLQNPTKTYSTPGTYTVSLTASNAGGSATHTKTNYVTVSAVTIPVASFTITPSSGDIPLTSSFDNTSTGIGSLTYSWNFGDTTTSNLEDPPVKVYTTKGAYLVSLTASNAGGTDTETHTVIASDPADRLDYSPSAQLMNWSTTGGGFPILTNNQNVTLTDFKKLIDVSNIKTIQVNSTTNPITTISNTDYYTQLETLDISNQSLTSLGVSELIGTPNLTTLNLSNNTALSNITISDLTNLRYVVYNNNNLSGTVDFSSRTPLILLSVTNENISAINVTGNTGLTSLYTYINPNLTQITGLNTCTSINVLQVWNCDLRGTGPTPINVSALTNLIILQISGNANLAALNVTNNTILRELYCQDDGLSTLDVTNNPELLILQANGNSLTTLNLTNNIKLKTLFLYANTGLTLPTGFSGLTQLEWLSVYNCNITVPLNCTSFTQLKIVDAGNTSLPSVNLSTCTNLESISIRNSPSVTTFNLPTTLSNTTVVSGQGCALTASAVNDILVKLDANGKVNPTPGSSSFYWVSLIGGTNAAPTGAGITAKNNLIAKGWSVTTN
jgi:PKD repeat protein